MTIEPYAARDNAHESAAPTHRGCIKQVVRYSRLMSTPRSTLRTSGKSRPAQEPWGGALSDGVGMAARRPLNKWQSCRPSKTGQNAFR